MAGEIVVFGGRTVAARDARIDASWRPPATMGDILAAVLGGASAIVIIDAGERAVPSVRHKEILTALSRGIPVYGGGATGALLAVDTLRWGAIGVGRVFELFRDGVLTDADEVVAGDTGDCVVDLRLALEDAVGPERSREPITRIKRLPHRDRGWDTLIADFDVSPLRARRATRDDALAMLRRVAADAAAGWPTRPQPFRVEPSADLPALLA